MPKQYEYTKVTAIHGTRDYDHGPTQGYAVRDRFDRNRHLGYVAKVGGRWQAVRPKQFGGIGFHNARHKLAGNFQTRWDAAERLRIIAEHLTTNRSK